uniref:C2H2-type domain-containing protein n=1 Tax=Caenorhabditis tropicalis TaxID=1561998 RepID=A0A1I7UN39_9PELO
MNRPVACLDCPESEFYPTVEDLEAHIATQHLHICPYECEKCKYAMFPTEFALATHCFAAHGMNEFSVKYRYTPELVMKKKELSQKLERCLTMDNHLRAEGKINETVSSTVEHRVKIETSEQGLMTNASISPGNIVDNANLHSYQAFLGEHSDYKNMTLNSYFSTSDETLTRHEEERTGPSYEDIPEGGGPVKPRLQIQCTLCPERVSKQRSSMVYHANTRHGKYELYECGYCHRKWQTIAKSDVIKHIKSHHERPDGSIDYDMVIDYRKNLGNKLKEITDKCFPEKKKKRIGYTDVPE